MLIRFIIAISQCYNYNGATMCLPAGIYSIPEWDLVLIVESKQYTLVKLMNVYDYRM